MTSEKFSLTWNDFQANISKSFGDLRKEEYFFDVTLISDDESKLAAHKLVLSSCSSFFKSILRLSSTSNPIIYLSGVSSQNLRFMLDYMYQGEVQIFQEQLDDFLTVAQKLKIEGLISDEKKPSVNNFEEASNQCELNESSETIKSEMKNTESQSDMQFSSFNGSLTVQDTSELDKTVEDLIVEENGIIKCKVCGKIAKGTRKSNMRQNLRKHVEIHIAGLTFECDICNKDFRLSESLRTHRRRCHNH